jgi:hypothetical protein
MAANIASRMAAPNVKVTVVLVATSTAPPAGATDRSDVSSPSGTVLPSHASAIGNSPANKDVDIERDFIVRLRYSNSLLTLGAHS